MNADDREAALALLRWYVEMGADEAIAFEAADRLAPPPASIPLPAPTGGQSPRPVPAAAPPALTEPLGEAAQSARRLASGNRTPTGAEIASCLPFVFRLIALVRPKVLVLSGGTAAGALLAQSQGITRLRGRWFELAVPGLDQPVPTLPMFHPSFLLRTPERKREAWRDLLSLRARLDELLAVAPPSG